MIRKIIGSILAVLGAIVATVILTGGGPILPHIIGPVVLISVGLFLLLMKGSTSKSPEA
jgi:hypothetical protein